MKYKDFINEERKTEMSFETAAQTYLKYCNNTPLDKVFVRGSSSVINMFVNDPMHSKRESESGNTLAMITVDHLMKQKYPTNTPLRQQGMIMATQASIRHARKFNSNIFYIIPFNDTKLAYIEDKDFNYQTKIRRSAAFMKLINYDDFASYAELIKLFEKHVGDVENLIKKLELGHLYKSKSYDEFFKDYFNFKEIGIEAVDNSTKIDQKGEYEVWTSGKCLLIHEKNWHEFLEYVKSLKLHNEK